MISFEAKTVFTEDETVVKIVRGFQRSWPHSNSWQTKGRAQKTVKGADGEISAAAVTTIVDFVNSLPPQECRAEMDNILKIGQENLGAPELAMVGVPVLVATKGGEGSRVERAGLPTVYYRIWGAKSEVTLLDARSLTQRHPRQ